MKGKIFLTGNWDKLIKVDFLYKIEMIIFTVLLTKYEYYISLFNGISSQYRSSCPGHPRQR